MAAAPGDTTAGEASATPSASGDVIVWADVAGTFGFVVTALIAAIAFTTPAQWVGAITAMALFAIGVFAFLWSFWNAVQRSRVEQIGVMQMYLLLGDPTPPRVRRIMLAALFVQIAVGLGTALARSESADGSPGTSLAVGILVPMFGLGLNGLWCAFHGTFPARADVTGESTTSGDSVGHNGEHG